MKSVFRVLPVCALVLAGARAEAKNAIQLENEKAVDSARDSWLPKLDSVTWQAVDIGINGTIDVYPAKWSVRTGESLGLRVSTTAARFRLRVYRIGWYGNSAMGPVGSRLVHEWPSLDGIKQAFPIEDDQTGIAEAKWKDVVTLTIPSDWVTGHYVVRATTDAGKEAYSYFIVRDDGAKTRAPIIYVDTNATAQAYNPWPKLFDASGTQIGGKSAYPYNSAGVNVKATGQPRAVALSFDRPYGENWGLGIWRDWTVPTVQWLEQKGFDVAYADDLDLDVGHILYGRKLFMDSGHDEYWSRGMWDSIEWARDKGLNLAWFSGNNLLWQVRYEPGSGGPKSTMTTYKGAAYPNSAICGTCAEWGGDPEFVLAREAKQKGDTTAYLAHLRNVTYAWPNLRDFDPVTNKAIDPPTPVARSPMPLQGLVNGPKLPSCGASPSPSDSCLGIPWIVKSSTHWIYTGAGVIGGVNTRLADGDRIHQVVGYEMDHARVGQTLSTRPKGQVILAATDRAPFTGLFNAQYYEHASGAKVFAAGTIDWSWALPRDGMGQWGSVKLKAAVNATTTVEQAVEGITINVLNKMTEGETRIPIPPEGIPGEPPPPPVGSSRDGRRDVPPIEEPIDDDPGTSAPSNPPIDDSVSDAGSISPAATQEKGTASSGGCNASGPKGGGAPFALLLAALAAVRRRR